MSSPLWIGPRAVLRRRVASPLARIAGRPLPSPIAGRIVMVTGASSGIGEATAKLVASKGATVVLVARRADELERVRSDIESGGGVATLHACDLTDDRAVAAMVEQVLAEHGHVDMLVNNAGRSIRRSIDLSYDRMHDYERTMAINFFAPVRLTLALMPSMRAQKFGHIVNVVTWGVQLKAPKFTAYIASKTALDVFARCAARETWDDGVTFTNVRMSTVHTPMTAATEAYDDVDAKTPEEAAQMILRALEDRPMTLDTLAGDIGELFELVAPRAMEGFMAQLHRREADSKAARGL